MLNNVIIPKYQSMKISEYFEYKKVDYAYLELIVTKANKNNNTEQIADLVNTMYVKTNKYICKDSKKLVIEQKPKASMYIHITNNKVQFFFMIPRPFLNKFKVKFQKCWKNIEIVEVDNIPVDVNSCSKFDVHYEKQDGLSISVDKRNNELLNSNMSIVNTLEDGEVVGIFYNFIPTSKKESNYFRSKTYQSQIKEYKNGKNLKKQKTNKDYAIMITKFLIDFINDLLNSLLTQNKASTKVINPITYEPSPSTKRKSKNDICQSQIILFTKTNKKHDKNREKELGKMLSNTFEEINDDNKLVVNEITKSIDIKRNTVNHVTINKTTVEEDSNFISMPSLEVIKQFNMIQHNKTVESPVPKELTTGIISLGMNKCKEAYQEAFLSTDVNLKSLPLAILGASRSGKSTFSVNMCKNIIEAGEGLIAIDFIKNTELAEDIKSITPPSRLIDIDLSKPEMIQSLCYNEFKINSNMSAYKISSISRKQTNNVLKIVNIINSDDKQLPPKMRKYLGAASRVAFCFEGSCMRDVLDILQFHTIRLDFINRLNDDLKEKLKDSLLSLEELNERGKPTKEKPLGDVIGTKESKIEGIIDRIDLMRENIIIDEMLNKNPKDNIDFVKAMEEQKVILIRMRDIDFDDDISIDILTSFFLQKIWTALKIRGTMHKLPAPVTVLIDEVFQTPCAQKILSKSFVQSAKFGLKYVLTLHYLQQLNGDTQRAMRNANASYMLIAGVDENAFSSFRSDFEKEGYCVEDLLNLERYESLNLIKTKNGRAAFITKLPAEIKK